jgi:DNA polymerase-4
VGISGTKYVAKVASGYRKPGGLTVVAPDDSCAWLAPQPVRVLWGAGPKTQARLAEQGIETVGDLVAMGESRLESLLGSSGRHFFALANGIDPRVVSSHREVRSLSSERTLRQDISATADVSFHLRKAADHVGQRLRRRKLSAAGVRVKLRCSDFRILTRQCSLAQATNASDSLYRAAVSLLPQFGDRGPVRLVGIAAYDLHAQANASQMDLLAVDGAKGRQLDRVLDEAAERFGRNVLRRARDLEHRAVLESGANLDLLRDHGDD